MGHLRSLHDASKSNAAQFSGINNDYKISPADAAKNTRKHKLAVGELNPVSVSWKPTHFSAPKIGFTMLRNPGFWGLKTGHLLYSHGNKLCSVTITHCTLQDIATDNCNKTKDGKGLEIQGGPKKSGPFLKVYNFCI